MTLIGFMVVSLLGTLLCLLRPFNPDNTRLCGRMFSFMGLKILGMRVSVEGKHHLENLSPCVVIANHQDNLDLFVHGGLVPRRTVSVGKKSLKYLPIFGQVYWLAGNIMIDRSKSQQSIDAMNAVTAAIRQHDTSIWVFPEGTRSRGRGLLPFKKGAFYMAMQAQVPILPICASNYLKDLDLNRWQAGKVSVRVLEPIPTTGLTLSDLPELIRSTHDRMAQEIKELDQDMMPDKTS